MAFYQLRYSQKIPASVAEVWDFIATPRNLKKITPAYMGFDILTPNIPERMYQGLIIAYTVRPVLGLPMTWVTEITHIKEGIYFVDEQRKGPYALWHHELWVEEIPGGTLMTDLVSYVPPMGFWGSMLHPLLIRPRLEEIFEYRQKSLQEIFGQY